MVIDTQVSANRFYEDQQRRGLHKYKPTDVGLPSYLDEFCQAVSNCMMPTINIAGNSTYQGVSTTADGGLDTTNLQAQSNITSVKGSHTLRGGVDYRLAMRRGGLMAAGNVSSSLHVRQHLHARRGHDRGVSGRQHRAEPGGADARHSDAGVDRAERADLDEQSVLRRVLPGHVARHANLTLNFGLRYEFEDGIKESEDRWITEFDPNAQLAITQLAQAAYARSPIPQVPVERVPRARRIGVCRTAPGASGLSWKGESMWMPRVSGAYKLGERTVIKGGYGLFFDTLNAGDYTGFNQLGYSVIDDQRREHRLRPDLAARRSEERRSCRWSIRSRSRRRRPVRAADRGCARRRRDSRHQLHA